MNRRKRPRDSIAETTNHHYPPNLLSRQNIRRPTIINPSIILLWRTCSVLFFTATWVFVSWMPLPSSAASSPTATRIILEEFYDTTHGDEWDTHTNWKVSDNVCDWYGIYCDGEEEVSRIELDRNQLSGSVPSALWRLPNLKHVNLRSNRLQDAGLGGLATDDDDTDPRSPLELLILSDNQLTTLKGIGNAKDTLQFVNLNKNQIDQSIPDEVFDLTNLKTLYLAFNQFTGTLSTAIGRLTKLTELYAFRNRLSGQIPSELGMLDKCQILGMGNNLWTGTLPTELNDMVNLRDLSIHNSEDGNGEGGEYTSQQQQSTSDQQRSAGIKGPLLSFGNMPFLGLLYLDGNDLTGTIPSDFLRHNNLTDSSVSIGLSYNNLTGAIPKALERFQSLNLDLVGNSIESIPPELCEKGGWMGGQVEEYKCNAILCPLGTYSPEGREIGADSECRPCADGYPYLGATKCLTGSTNQEPWEILAGFYLAMGGDKWENKDGWEIFDNLFNGETFEELEQINIDICNGWYGILCHDGVPERLSLPNNSLFGVVPKMIFEVKWNAFDLSDNNVIVDDLTIILHPKALTSLILSNVKVNRLDGLANLGNLEQLYLDGLEIEGTIPDVLFDLTNLKTLHLQHGKFDGALSTKIGNLVNLEMLNFYGNAFSGKLPTELGRLTYLRALDLSENNFSGTLPTEVAKLKNITRFALHQTEGNLGGPLPAFDTFPLLKGLYLQSNSFTGQIADNFIGGIMDKKSEVIVSLASNRLVGSVPESLAAFETLILDLESNGITKLDSQLCIHDQWMRGELGRLPQISRCNAILCPPGTWNEFGKETVEEKCKECGKDTVTFGQTKCGDAQRESREKEILDGLFSMTGGRYWTKPHDNWLKPGVSVCQREGVVCSGDNGDEQHVLEIDLHDFGLRGTIPSDIWELSQVSTLRFSFNAVSVSFQGIANAKALRILDMGHCHLRNLDGMQEAPQGLAEIHLSANQFEATLPREIFELTGIVYQLFLNNNHFSGRLSSEIGKLTHLRQFYLGGNTFTGRIPSEIGLLTNLIGLGLRSNSFTSLPQEIEKLSSLVRLDLSLNQFDSQAFPSFSKNSQLVTIDASSNAFSGFLPKDLLSSVDPKARIDVNLSSNAFVGSVPESWSRFESLNLDLSDNQLTALPETLCTQNSWNGGRVGLLDTCDAILCPPGTHLTGLGRQTDPLQPCETCDEGILSAPFYGMQDCLDPKLVAERNILVSFYDATNGTSWLTQRNWLSLKPVCIWHGIVCNENGFVDSIQLEDNFLVSGPETMDDVSAILTLNELKTLDLKGNDVLLDFQTINQEMTQLEFLRLSGMGLSSLEGISNAVNLKAFHVTNNKITKIPEELYTMTSLESIFLSFNSIQGTISTKIGQLTNLKECYLFGNSLAGSIPSEIGLMTSLAEFVVAHNLLSGSLPDQISYLANLEQLSVYRQQGVELLTGPVPSFSGAPKLWYFDASDNDLTGPIPDNFLINSIHLNKTVTINLKNNEITLIPRELSKFKFLDINLAGNVIETIPEELCSIPGWMQGHAGEIGNCSAILCPVGTFNQFGRHTPENACLECSHLASIKLLGQTHCKDFTTERDTLSKLFVETGGEFWENGTSWNTDAPICSWFGILCSDGDLQDAAGVTHITLESIGLSGTLPSEIWTLPVLRSFKLDGNEGLIVNFEGIANAADTLEVLSLAHTKMSSVEGLGSLTSLKKLSLAGNELTGIFPNEIFKLSNTLESLYIGSNMLYGPLPTRLAEMTRLQVFNAFNNDFFSTIPTELASMKNLRTLVLSDNLIYGQIPQEMSSMPSLQGFAADREFKSGPSLSGPLPSFDQNPQLIFLYLQGNQLQGSIPRDFLSASKSARFIGLSNNFLTGQVPSELEFLTGLDLLLDGNEIVGFPDSFCSKMDWMAGVLGEYGCEGFLCPPGTASPIGRAMNKTTECQVCADPEAASFYGSTSCDGKLSEREILVNLYIALNGDKWYRNDFWLTETNVCVWYGIACSNRKVVQINLRGNNLSGLPPPEIFQLRQLQILWLYSNPITFSFENIGRATNLQDLRLDATELHSLHGIGAATSLISFDASFTNIRSSFPEEFLRLTNLRVLSLGHSGLTGTLPTSFADMKMIQKLRLNSNRLSGTVPAFDDVHFLKHVDLSDNLLAGGLGKSFLSKISKDTAVTLRLSKNQLTGVIPEAFDRFGNMSLHLSDNNILGMPLTLCDNSEWNNGDVGAFGCDSILCKPGSYNAYGRRVLGMDCYDCPSAIYYGETSCRTPLAASGRGDELQLSVGIASFSLFAVLLLAM